MSGSEILALQGQCIEGFVKIELIRKDGVKITEKHNMITPPGKHYLLNKSAGKMLDMNGSIFGSTVKQGVELNSTYGDENSPRLNSTHYERAITNLVLSLSDAELGNINAQTNFINYFDENLVNASKVLGYANASINPFSDGKEGTVEPVKGSEAIKTDYITRKFKYADGVATGLVGAIAMAPMTAITSPYGIVNNLTNEDRNAPGFTISKCLDRVNPQSTNFVGLSSSFLPPGIAGFTSDTEVLYNYNQDGSSMHKIDLLTGEITDITDITDETTFTTFKDITGNSIVYDYLVDDGYLYILVPQSTSRYGCTIYVYDIINKRNITSYNVSGGNYTRTGRFFKHDGNVYVGHILYSGTGNVLTKLSKGSNSYYSSGTENLASHDSILTLPSGINKNHVCFGNYGDNYIMYVARYNGLTDGGFYLTGYIFTDLNNIAGSIIDCIPSIHYAYEIVFKNNSISGILSIGKNRLASAYSDSYYESNKYVVSRDGTTKINLTQGGLFYTPDKSWTNTISIVKLDQPLTKNTNDVMYITYGYRIK